MKILSSICLGCALIAALLSAGCRQNRSTSNAAAPQSSSAEYITKAEVIRGPLTFRLKVSRDKISFTDQITFIMEATAPEKFSFQFPPFGEGLQDQFGIADYQTDTPVLNKDGSIFYRRTYFLDPVMEGRHTIPPISVCFQETPPHGKKHLLESEAFTLEVTMPPAEYWKKLDIDDRSDLSPASSLHPGRDRKIFLCILIGSVLLLTAAVIFLAVRSHRRKHRPVPPVPAHLIAFQELQQLIDEDLISQNLLKEFYEKISGILRRYIEARFCVRAPELTTEEFLLQLTTAQTLLKQHQVLLTQFLQFCDMVKFARHQPETQDIQQTFDACKSFIAATQEATES